MNLHKLLEQLENNFNEYRTEHNNTTRQINDIYAALKVIAYQTKDENTKAQLQEQINKLGELL